MKNTKKTFQKNLGRAVAYFSTTKLNWLRIIGLGMVAFGIGMISLPFGVIAGGIALLLIEWSVEEDGV